MAEKSEKSANASSSEALVAAMMEPGFYPKPPRPVTHRETHISHLFLAGDLVYKIKKPVQFSFLDFSTLAKRRYYLEQEFELNRRLAPSVYLRIVPIGFDGTRWELDGSSKPAEYALVMRRKALAGGGHFLLVRTSLGESRRQIVQAITPGGPIAFDQAVSHQTVERIVRPDRRDLPDRCGGGDVEGVTKDRQHAPELLQAGDEQFIAHA